MLSSFQSFSFWRRIYKGYLKPVQLDLKEHPINIIPSSMILITMVIWCMVEPPGVVEYLLIAIFDHCRGSAKIQPVRNMKLDLTGRSRATYRMRRRRRNKIRRRGSLLPVWPGLASKSLKRGFANTMEGGVTLSPCTNTVINYNLPTSIITTPCIQILNMIVVIIKLSFCETVVASGLVGLTKVGWNLHIQGILFQLSA